LPGRFGIGDIGPGAVDFLDVLHEAHQGWWQMLPLGPVGTGFSPYQSASSFAGNPLLVSPDRLLESGWLAPGDLRPTPRFPASEVDPGAVRAFKGPLLETAYRNFGEAGRESKPFQAFLRGKAAWLDDYALFEAIREQYPERSWASWPRGLARRIPQALERAKEQLADRIAYYCFVQFAFHTQWEQLRAEAKTRGIRLIGDVPIFVAFDSADVWANPELFQLDSRNRPRAVAGVPPDYFNNDGQLWGNPVYDWTAHHRQSFAWWIRRVMRQLEGVDLIRLDHFRGFESYWEIPARSKTAKTGRWVAGPRDAIFTALREQLGRLPFIAEDLGEITPEVNLLRERFALPGMKVLQFAFGGASSENPYLPHNYEPHCVVYTGTHDNDTTKGWFRAALRQDSNRKSAAMGETAFALAYLDTDAGRIHRSMIRAAYASVADLAIIPMQDILGLGSEARMNIPGQPEGNWVWRLTASQIKPEAIDELGNFARMYGRASKTPTPAPSTDEHAQRLRALSRPRRSSKQVIGRFEKSAGDRHSRGTEGDG
jgi:4-alpha-glucanotransferase